MSQFQPQDPFRQVSTPWCRRFFGLGHVGEYVQYADAFVAAVEFCAPSAGLIVPIVMWALQKDNNPTIDAHGKVIINWIISALIYMAISFVLTFFLVGILGFLIMAIVGIIFPILGAVKANNGELWPYPLSIPFLK